MGLFRTSAPHPTRAYYASSVSTFVESDADAILGQLATRVASEHRGNEIQQIESWRREIELLRVAFLALGCTSSRWGLLLELPLLRLGRRIDAVALIGAAIAVVEFKIGSQAYSLAGREQVEDYALCLRDFHDASAGRLVVPILCAEKAPRSVSSVSLEMPIDFVSKTLLVNEESLADSFRSVATAVSSDDRQIDWLEFDKSAYNPTPAIVEAARAIYAGHAVHEIGRADATGESLNRAADRLRQIVNAARQQRNRSICLVTGTPGSGKTLLGLDLVFSGSLGSVAGEPAAMLSGNPPLVHVLREALAEDAAHRQGTKAEARRRAQAALQTLLGYLKEHADAGGAPPEHVIVYDEAQRAWDEETGKKLLGRSRSEPALFLEILSRLPWCCLVCLVGPGQEINRGEGGLALWVTALLEAARRRVKWHVHAAPPILGMLNELSSSALVPTEEADLQLMTDLRAYRNTNHDQWVSTLLDGNIERARALAASMHVPPAHLTRNLSHLRAWLNARRRGGRRIGLLVSSGASRLVAEGIPPSPRSNELDSVVHWFLRPYGDFRSSNALEVPLSEFVCQGLELDYVGLCWGGDLIWTANRWMPRAIRAPNWQEIRKDTARKYRLNAYRVLLTRARAGLAIYIPHGDVADRTRNPDELQRTFQILESSGCVVLDRIA